MHDSTLVLPSADVASLLQRAVEEAARLLHADGGMVYLVDEETGDLRLTHDAGITSARRQASVRGLRLPIGSGMFGTAFVERRVQLTGDYPNDASFPHTPDADRVVADATIRSMVVAPLIDGDEALGALGAFASRPHAFGDADVALVRALAEHAAAAMANRRLIDRLARSEAELASKAEAERALRELAARITSSHERAEILDEIATQATTLLGGEVAAINLFAPAEGSTGWGRAVRPDLGSRLRMLDAIPLDPSLGISGLAISQDRVVWTDDYLADARFSHSPDRDAYIRENGVRAVICAPLRDERGPIGVIQVHSTAPAVFGERHAEILRALADHAAIALTNARLIEELDASRRDIARRAEVERSLREIGARVTALREVDEVIQRTIDEAVRLLGADGGRVDVVDAQSRLLRGIYSTGEEPPGPDVWPDTPDEQPEDGIAGQAVARNAVVRTADYLADESFPHISGTDHYVRTTGIRSVIAAPMPGEDGPFGAVTVFSTEPDAFGPADEGTLAALAEQTAVALTNARLISQLASSREEVMRRATAEHVLGQIAAALASIREPDAVLQRVVDETARLVGADGTILSLLDPSTNELRWSYDDGLRTKFDPEYVATLTLPLGVGPTGLAVSEARMIRVDRDLIREFPDGPENDRFFETTGFRSMVSVPIVADSGPLGALEVYSCRDAGFSEADEALLGALAGHAAIALTNAHLIEELDRSRDENARRAERERSLREIAARVTAIRQPDEVLERVVREARRLLGASGAVIDLIDPASGAFRRAYDDGVDAAMRDEWVALRVGEGVVREVVRRRTVAYTDDYLADGASPEEAAWVEQHGVRSLAVAPLVAESLALGTLGVFSDRPGRWNRDHADLLAALADQAAIAVTNARLIEELERSRGELGRRVESERALREIAARVTALHDPDDVLSQVVDEASRLLGSDGGHLTLLDDAGRFLDPVVVAGVADAETESWFRSRRFPVGTGINGLAAGENRVVATYDYPSDPRISEEAAQDFAARLGIHAMAAAPLREPGGGVIGTLAISYADARELGPDELGLLQGLADHAAIAVANTRLLERLRESEARYRFLVENSPDIVFSTDAEGLYTYYSDTVERVTGWRPDELLGQHFSSIVDMDTFPDAAAAWQGFVDAPSRMQVSRFSLRTRDGRRLPVEVSAVGMTDTEGRFAGIHGAARDMTERERLERELRASESRYRHLVQNSPDLVWAIDADARFTFLSDTAERLTGWKPDELLGEHFGAIVHPDSREVATRDWTTGLRDGANELRGRLDLLHRDGHAVPAEFIAQTRVENGRFVGANGSVRDMTERDRLETGLRRQAAELAASEERAHLARELHDSVTQALFSMTLLTRTIELLMPRDPDGARDKLASLRDLQRDALAEMRSLIFELRPGSLEQDGLVHALRTHCAAVEGRIGLPILLDAEPLERLPIEIEDALYRIAQEALHNIVKHAGARQVRISLRRVDGSVRLRIEDDGKGFDPTAIPTGHLGVAGMRSRAERIGATLVVDSRPGRGTRIEVTAPVEAAGSPDGDGHGLDSAAASIAATIVK